MRKTSKLATDQHTIQVTMETTGTYWPRFSAEAFISLMVRGHRAGRPPTEDPWPLPPPLLLVLFLLTAALPGECRDWLLWRRIVGSRATKDALCLKLEDARLMRDLRFDPNLSGWFVSNWFKFHGGFRFVWFSGGQSGVANLYFSGRVFDSCVLCLRVRVFVSVFCKDFFLPWNKCFYW